MLERGQLLTIGVWYFSIVQPFADQQRLAAGLGCQAVEFLQVTLFHGQDQIRRVQHLGGDLTGPVLWQREAGGGHHLCG